MKFKFNTQNFSRPEQKVDVIPASSLTGSLQILGQKSSFLTEEGSFLTAYHINLFAYLVHFCLLS